MRLCIYRPLCRAMGLLMLVLISGASAHAQEQAPTSLEQLLLELRAASDQEAKHNTQRIARFLEARDQRASLLQEAREALAAAQRRSDDLKSQYDANEAELAELETLLQQRQGDLGELFGVVRQVSGDLGSVLESSLSSAQIGAERVDFFHSLAESRALPSMRQLERFWLRLMEEITLAGQVTRFPSTISRSDGTQYQAPVVRVGVFNAIVEDRFLQYLPAGRQLMELPRQPSGRSRNLAAELYRANQGLEPMALDPSRGALLGLLVQSPNLRERIQQGRLVGYVILAIGAIGLLILIERFFALGRTERRMHVQQRDLEHPNANNPLGCILLAYYENRHRDLEVLIHKLDEAILKAGSGLDRGLSSIKILAAVAPMLGLLGTVVGMIATFQSITLFGTGDPKLMAGGISQALITTVLGLAVAIPLILLHSLLATRAAHTNAVIEEQAAGLVAAHAEQTTSGAKREQAARQVGVHG